MPDDEEDRIALFLDYENLAIGARESLGRGFDFKPIADALAERGRVVVRRAYADWTLFEDDRKMLTRSHVELIEIPQRMGAGRKNAADIKMAVDAMEMALGRDYLATFVVCTGDSDFTPLVHKLRELNKRVIGVGMRNSTSSLLPPACDEFLFYEGLEGVDAPQRRKRADRRPREEAEETTADTRELPDLDKLVSQTVAGLKRSSGGAVLASTVKRALLRKDPTFTEADYGFRAFGELLRHLEDKNVIELTTGAAKGDHEVGFPSDGRGEEKAFAELQTLVADLQVKSGHPALSGLKNEMRKRSPGFSEKKFGFNGFLQFAKAASTRGYITLEWDEAVGDYLLGVGLPDRE